jgi:hypothetical protein
LLPTQLVTAVTATASLVPSPESTASPQDITVYVVHTDGVGVFLRQTPNLADRLTAWPEGTQMNALGNAEIVDGLSWRQVRAPSGQIGYVPSQYLDTIPPPSPTARPSPTQPPSATPTSRPPPTATSVANISAPSGSQGSPRIALENEYVNAGFLADYPQDAVRSRAGTLSDDDLRRGIARFRREAAYLNAAFLADYPRSDVVTKARAFADAQLDSALPRFRLEAAYLNAAFLADYPRSDMLPKARALTDAQLGTSTERFRLEAAYINRRFLAGEARATAVARARTLSDAELRTVN